MMHGELYSGISNMTGIGMILSFQSPALVCGNGSGFCDFALGI